MERERRRRTRRRRRGRGRGGGRRRKDCIELLQYTDLPHVPDQGEERKRWRGRGEGCHGGEEGGRGGGRGEGGVGRRDCIEQLQYADLPHVPDQRGGGGGE